MDFDLAFKSGVVMWDMSPAIQGKLITMNEVTKRVLGRRLCITSARDSEHSIHSKHYTGEAIDLRCWELDKKAKYANELQTVLGSSYDVVAESDHIHVEFDPPKPRVPSAYSPSVPE